MSISNVIDGILENAVGLPALDIKATILIKQLRVEALKVIAITRREFYVDDLFENSMISLAMTPGQYSEMILAGHEDLIMHVSRTPINGGKTTTTVYVAVLDSVKDPRIEGNYADIDNVDAGESTEISVVTFQIIPKAVYDIRLREVAGTFLEARPYEVLRYFLNSMKLEDDYSEDEIVAKIVTDNSVSKKVWDAIVVPETIPFLSLVDYLHDNYGLASQGIGCFLKNKTWNIFTPYTTEKKNLDLPRLTVVNASPARYRQLEKNFNIIGKSLSVVATGETKHVKHSDAQALNAGVGIRFTNHDKVNPNNVKDVDPTAAPESSVTSFRARDYGNKYNRIATAKNPYTANPAAELSKLALQAGEIVETIWENGTIDVLTPGMPVKFIYSRNEVVQIKHGTLMSAEEFTYNQYEGMIENSFVTNVKLVLFLKQ